MAKRWMLVLPMCFVLVSAGCISQMTGISPSTTPITANDSYQIIGKTNGKAWGVMLWAIPLFESNPSKKAVQRGNAMIEVCQDTNMFFLLLVSLYWTNVNGTAVKVERGGARVAEAPATDARPELARAAP